MTEETQRSTSASEPAPNPLGPEPAPAELVRIEAAALQQLAARLEGPLHAPFARLVELIADVVRRERRIVLTGVGKSGLIARKIAATFISTGTPALFLHATDALHGDLGLLGRGDLLLALSYSGETDEVLNILPAAQGLGATLVSFCGCVSSTLASASALVLDVSVEREACTHQLAPTASTAVMMALGDALAISVSRSLRFEPRDFAALHPGGHLGRRLATVGQLMHSGEALPQVPPRAAMPEIIHEMSAKRLGVTAIAEGDRLLGVLSDGDLRRLLERSGPDAFNKTAADVMNPRPRTIAPDVFAADALALMEQHKITALVVTQDGTTASAVQGMIHMHDLVQALALKKT
jgi:arabinose-5-phosphate isomerase